MKRGDIVICVILFGQLIFLTSFVHAQEGDTYYQIGNINGDNDPEGNQRIDLSDPVALLNYLFQGGPAPECLKAADTNDDKKVDITDSIFLLNYLFLGGSEISSEVIPIQVCDYVSEPQGEEVISLDEIPQEFELTGSLVCKPRAIIEQEGKQVFTNPQNPELANCEFLIGGEVTGGFYPLGCASDGKQDIIRGNALCQGALDYLIIYYNPAIGDASESSIVLAHGGDGGNYIAPSGITSEGGVAGIPLANYNDKKEFVQLGLGEGDAGGETVSAKFIILGGEGEDSLLASMRLPQNIQAEFDYALYGLGEGDTIVGSNFRDYLDGGEGDDRDFHGRGHNDVLNGGPGEDHHFYGGFGDDVLNGDGGDDYNFYGEDGDDVINGGDDNDYNFFGFMDDDVLNGGPGEDYHFYGGFGDDVLNGGPGDDYTFYGEFGSDILNGGSGSDYIFHGGDRSDILYNAYSLQGDKHNDLLLSEQPPEGKRNILEGGDDSDVIIGTLKRDDIYGGDRDDLIFGSPIIEIDVDSILAAHQIRDSQGNIRYDSGTIFQEVFSKLRNSEAYVLLKRGELPQSSEGDGDIIYGDCGNDLIIAGGGINRIFGENDGFDPSCLRSGDWIIGGKDMDTLYGEQGRDVVYGNDGEDILFGDYQQGNYPNSGDFVCGGAQKDFVQGDTAPGPALGAHDTVVSGPRDGDNADDLETILGKYRKDDDDYFVLNGQGNEPWRSPPTDINDYEGEGGDGNLRPCGVGPFDDSIGGEQCRIVVPNAWKRVTPDTIEDGIFPIINGDAFQNLFLPDCGFISDDVAGIPGDDGGVRPSGGGDEGPSECAPPALCCQSPSSGEYYCAYPEVDSEGNDIPDTAKCISATNEVGREEPNYAYCNEVPENPA